MNIVELISAHADATPDAKALVYGTDSYITYKQLMHNVRRAANQLRRHRPGTHVGIVMRDTVEQVYLRLASMQVGVIAVPLTSRVPKPEFDKRAKLFELDTIYTDAEYSEHLSGYNVTRVDNFDLAFGAEEYHGYHSSDHDRMCMAWSGGTNGTPSGLYYSHASMKASADNSNRRWNPNSKNEVFYPVVPQFSGAFIFYLFIALTHGHALVTEVQPFTPVLVANNVVNHQVSHIMGTAPVFSTILRRGTLPRDGHVPRRCYASGDSVSVQIQKQWQDHYGTKLYVMLAASQTGGFCEQSENDPLDSIGTPWPEFTEVRLCDDNGNDVPDGEVGQLWIRNPSCAVGDVSVEGHTSFDSKGYITTRDMLMRRNGLYYMAGRKDDTFKVNGQFVSVLKIEDHVREIPGVFDAVAVPDFDLQGLPRVKVYIVPEPEHADAEQIKNQVYHMSDYLLSHERPRSVEFIDEVPRHPGSMKLQRFRLHPLYKQVQSA